MECNCNNNNNRAVIPWVRGNRLPLVICVYEDVVTQEGEGSLVHNKMERVPYEIQAADTVTVVMKSGFRQVEMPFTTEGNKVLVTDNGELAAGTYTVEVTIVRGDGARGRWQETRQVRVYENTSDAQLGEMYAIEADLFFYAKGDTGNGIADITANPDDTLTITMTDGTTYTTQAMKGDKGDKGDQGEKGTSIVSFDVTGRTDTSVIYTVTFSDDTTEEVAVPKGPQGDTGLTGNGIASTTLNSDYTLTIAYTDGTTYTTPSIRGAQGVQGVSIIAFTQTGETATNTLYNVVFSDGRTQSVAIPKGVKGDKGDTGDPGSQGAQGIQGIQGPQGERGPQGNTGVQVDSVASIIHSIDPTATYAAADVAGADAVQDVLAEVTELAGEANELEGKLFNYDMQDLELDYSVVVKKDSSTIFLDYLGKIACQIVVTADPGVTYRIAGINKATGNLVSLSGNWLTGNQTFINPRTDLELINIRVTGSSSLSTPVTVGVKIIKTNGVDKVRQEMSNSIAGVNDTIARKIVTLSLADDLGNISGRLSNDTYGYNITTKEVIYKDSNGNVTIKSALRDSIYFYQNRYYKFDGSSLIMMLDADVLSNDVDITSTNSESIYDIEKSNTIVFKKQGVLSADNGFTILSDVGKVDKVVVRVLNDTGVGFLVYVRNKATGNVAYQGILSNVDNVTGDNTITLTNTGNFYLSDLHIKGSGRLSRNETYNCVVIMERDNNIPYVVASAQDESIRTTLSYSSDTGGYLFYRFRKGARCSIKNVSDAATIVGIVDVNGSTDGWNSETINPGMTVDITVEKDGYYLRANQYFNSPVLEITEMLPIGVINNRIDIEAADNDSTESYLAFADEPGIGFIPSDGSINANSAFCSTTYLPYNGEDIVVRGYSSSNVNLLSYYGSDLTYLGGLSGAYFNNVVVRVKASDIPSGTAYVRVTGSLVYINRGESYPKKSNYISLIGEDKYANRRALYTGIYTFNLHNKIYDPGTVETFDTSRMLDINYWYGMYDGLVADYGDYVSKIDCDALYAQTPDAMSVPAAMEGLPIYMYKFSPRRTPLNDNMDHTTSYNKLLKIFICTGTHPEYMAIYDCYKMMKAICADWVNDDNLNRLRWDVEFYIMPVSGSSVCSTGNRTNYNGVDLNRNSPGFDWKLTEPGTNTYGGPTPGSEYETKVFTYMLDYVKPHVFIDHHNAGSETTKTIGYADSLNEFAIEVAGFTYRQMTAYLKTKKFPGVLPGIDTDPNDDPTPYILAYASHREMVGCSRDYYAHDKGILSLTFETSKAFNWANGHYQQGTRSDWYNQNACTTAVIVFTNFIINLASAVSQYALPSELYKKADN